ncbi:hypothetical protein V5O48_019157 [Marasmius crinis-equi]|uniref:NAD(P)-binding domain-containing protein n=1 Tax=Marasmius crinis-equi TaxID=585013 RepID=A0ABR3EJ79_9AGAR
MKLIVTGATGYVATEVIKQALRMPAITSIVALARRPVKFDQEEAGQGKLKSVVVKEYDHYPEEVKAEFAGANACIWTVAITPAKSKMYDFKEVKRICQDSPIAGFKAMIEAGPAKPFKFLYFSGDGIERDRKTTPMLMGDYLMMRGEAESQVLAIASSHSPDTQACVVRPGIISSTQSIGKSLLSFAAKIIPMASTVSLEQMAAACLQQIVNEKGFEKDTLSNAELVEIGSAALEKK